MKIYYVVINNIKYPFPDRNWAMYFARIKRKEGFKEIKVVSSK